MWGKRHNLKYSCVKTALHASFIPVLDHTEQGCHYPRLQDTMIIIHNEPETNAEKLNV
jgi:hypothetical protein